VLPAMGPVLGEALAKSPLGGELQIFDRYLELAGVSYELMFYRPAADEFVCIFRNTQDSGPFFEATTHGCV
jgi:hypothetical protein